MNGNTIDLKEKEKYQAEPLQMLTQKVSNLISKQADLMQRLLEIESMKSSDFQSVRKLPDSLVRSIKRNATVKREW